MTDTQDLVVVSRSEIEALKSYGIMSDGWEIEDAYMGVSEYGNFVSKDELQAIIDKAQPVSGAPFGFCLKNHSKSKFTASHILMTVEEYIEALKEGLLSKEWKKSKALYTSPQPIIPSGYALVPIEPTEEMINALMHEWDSVGCISMYENYEAMLSVVNVDIETATELKDKRIEELKAKLKIAVEALKYWDDGLINYQYTASIKAISFLQIASDKTVEALKQIKDK